MRITEKCKAISKLRRISMVMGDLTALPLYRPERVRDNKSRASAQEAPLAGGAAEGTEESYQQAGRQQEHEC